MIYAKGRKPNPVRSRAIKNMPALTNVSALLASLGLANYDSDFILNRHILRVPLNKLLKKIKNRTRVPNISVLLRK